MAYSKTVWNNNTPPDISAENLNKMEQGIYDAQFPDGGSTGQILSKTNDGTGWVDAPTSAEWGNITGQLSEQTDLYSELESKITMPSGGTTGQVLTKTATGQAWDDVDGLPAGGTAGQVLTKNSSTDGDASWQTSPSGGGGTWGYISGTLTDQTDLVAALDAKANTSTLATVESTSTASQTYSVGDYLVYNGILYKVISAIDSGETLTPNTNIEATTTGAELTSLNKGLSPQIRVLNASDMTFPSQLSLYQENSILMIGKIAILNISIKCTNGSGSLVIRNYIPTGFRPRTKVNAVAETGLGDGKLQPIAIGIDGSATIYPVNSGTTYIIGTAVFVLS